MFKTENLTFGTMDVAKQTDFILDTRKLFSLQLLVDQNDSCIRNFYTQFLKQYTWNKIQSRSTFLA
jgi:hypothetical protein